MNDSKCKGHERVTLLNAICERDKTIDELKIAHKKELAEKDKTIAYYAKTAELATQRKKQAIRNAERRAKLNLSYAALILAGMMVIPWVLWLFDGAMKAFWLWGNGR